MEKPVQKFRKMRELAGILSETEISINDHRFFVNTEDFASFKDKYNTFDDLIFAMDNNRDDLFQFCFFCNFPKIVNLIFTSNKKSAHGSDSDLFFNCCNYVNYYLKNRDEYVEILKTYNIAVNEPRKKWRKIGSKFLKKSNNLDEVIHE